MGSMGSSPGPRSSTVLATLKRDELIFGLRIFLNLWSPHFPVSTPHFGWTPRLEVTALSHASVTMSFGKSYYEYFYDTRSRFVFQCLL